jgi:prepilin-type N-terminal cleavage/methylation domain-containing protein
MVLYTSSTNRPGAHHIISGSSRRYSGSGIFSVTRKIFRGGVKMKRSKKGFTLIELMIVSSVYIGIIVAIWGVLLGALNHAGMAREVTIATDDLKDVMERMRSIAFPDITVEYPHNTQVSASDIGGFLLPSETITVRYPQGAGADPLEISVEIAWTSKNGRTLSRIMKTVRTRRL